MISVAKLEPDDFQDPVQSLAKIRHRFADVDPETAILFFIQLSTFLVNDKRQEWVAAVHELDAGLSPGEYADVELVAARLRARTQDFSPVLGFFYGIRLGNVLGLTDRSQDQLKVVEALLGLQQEDYQDPSRLRSVLENRPQFPLELWAGAVQMLSSALGVLGRRSECVAVLEAALGLSPEDYANPDHLRNKLLAAAGPVEATGSILGYLTLLSKALQDLGRYAESISLYEADLDIEAADYRNVSSLAAKIRARRAPLPPEMFVYSTTMFLMALVGAERYRDGLAVLGADLEVDLDQIEIEDLKGRLQLRCSEIPDDITGFYLGTVTYAMAIADRSTEAVAVLEADSDLMTLDWQDTAALAMRLKGRLGDLAPSARLLYVNSLASALEIAGHDERAALLADAYLRYVSPIGTEPPDSGLMSVYCAFFEDWLKWWGQDSARKPLEACRDLVPVLRQVLAEQGVKLVDRERVIKQVSDLRRRIIQTGLYWVEKEDSRATVSELRREVFLWDLELAQRLLVERYLLTEPQVSSGGQAIPSGVWPLSKEERVASKGYLPDDSEVADLSASLEKNQAPAPSVKMGKGQPHQALIRRFEDLVHRGLDDVSVAESLSPNGLLVRATFDPDGRLVWGALRPSGSRLDLVRFGAGRPGDLLRLRWATARHDFAMGLLYWSERTLKWKLAGLRRAARSALPRAFRSLTAAGKPREQLPAVLQELTASLPPGSNTAELLRLFRHLTWPLEDDTYDSTFLRELHLAEQLAAGCLQQRPSQEVLNSITADYLRRVAEIWDLFELEGVLTRDTDLIVQGDDVLHAVPVAWLPIDGESLYRQVRSVRSSLAPQFDALLGQLSEESSIRSDDRRLLSISYLSSNDAAREGACWLHHGHSLLAERFGAVSFAGADAKTGTVSSFRSTLEKHRSFVTAAIYGHGDYENAGIRLGGDDGEAVLWDGRGCDLSGVDWLLLVSCSIGRASRTGDLDVEGFCVQLAIHRARSILACRWPVSSKGAAAFANEAVRQYLELEGQPQRRALALAAARRAVCEGEKPRVGLNTAAAFELYGLG